MTEQARTMRAVVMDGFGAPGVLRVARVPVPEPGEDEVLVRVSAAGVNAIDWATRAGQGVGVPRFPAVPGWDLSGTVVATGEHAGRFAAGDEVFGMPRFPAPAGAYAEYAVAPEAELSRKPAGLGHHLAATAPMVGLTAWQSLFEHGRLTAGQRVLVSGAAGGVGHIAVQLAVDAGARVVGTASPGNHAFVLGLGAEQAVDHRTDRLRDAVGEVDLVVDPMGGPSLLRLLDVVRTGGTVVTLKGEDPEFRTRAAERGVRAGFTYVRPDAGVLDRVAELLAEGRVVPEVQRVFRLEEAARAHEFGEAGHVRGRLVLALD
ncbi:NADP-dependent oxidoreductase [Streptomyces sp. NPDC048182]|uniref:NADP-dependent oxidoreductase n=1 Tax=Streptomyces sp. NPDC048182 TaxID=3365507 RepID=UPI00371DEF86